VRLRAYSTKSIPKAVQLKASLELENAPTTRREGLQTMSKGVLAWLGSVMMTGAVGAQTQTTVVTTSLTAGAIPVFGTTSGSNSPVTSISVSGGNVGIGTTAPPTAVLEVNGTAKVDGALTLAGSQILQHGSDQSLSV
jgi:hypothetical protein